MGPSQWGVKGGDFFLLPPPHQPRVPPPPLPPPPPPPPPKLPLSSPLPLSPHKLPLPWLHFLSRKVRIPVLSIFLFWVHYWVSFLIGGCIYIVKMEKALKEREKAVEMKEAMHRVIPSPYPSPVFSYFFILRARFFIGCRPQTLNHPLPFKFVFGVYYSSVHSQKFRFHKLAHKKHWKIHRGYYCRKVRQFWRSHWFYGIYGMGFTWPVLLCRTF